MNTFFKFVDEVVLVPYLRSKGLDMETMTEQSIRNQRTRATRKWDELLGNIDLDDMKHNSRRWIVVQNGEFSIVDEGAMTEANRVLPYDSFMMGFIDYTIILQKAQEALPKLVTIEIERNVTRDGHAKLSFKASTGDNYVSALTQAAFTRALDDKRSTFYLDPLVLDEYSAQFAGQVTDDLALWMGDAVDILDSANTLAANMRSALISAMRERRGVVGFEYKVPTHDTSAQFEKFLGRISSKFSNTTEQVIAQMPVAKHGKLASRRWGIEVETGGARGAETPAEWGRKYDGSLESAYGSSSERYIEPSDCDDYDHYAPQIEEYVYAGRIYTINGEEVEATEGGYRYIDNPRLASSVDFSCESCGWVENYYDDDYEDGDCAEFVSPILKSFHSRGLEQLLSHLHTQPQNNSSGIHVHVEAKDLTPKQIGSLVVAYQMIEPLIESSYNRKTRSYCKVRPARDVVDVMKGAKKAKFTPAQGMGYDNNFYTGDRYHSVNLCSLSSHGTVEFRAMGPVATAMQLENGDNQISYEHLIKWASFCREMVNVARNGAPVKAWTSVKNFQDVINIFVKYGKEVPAILGAELAEQLEDVSEMAEV